MRNFEQNFEQKFESLRIAVQHNSRLTEIAKEVKASKGTTFYRLQKLKKEGLIFQRNSRYYLTEKGFRTNDPQGPTFRTEVEQKKILRRHHHITICLAHKEPARSWKKRFTGNMVTAYVGSIGEKLTFQFTNTGVQFNTREPVTDDIIRDVGLLHKKSLNIAVYLERRFKIRLVRPGDMGMKKLYSELAYLQTGWAEHEIEGKQRKIWFYNWKDDGKPRFLFDKSYRAEFEEVGKTVDDDALETAFFLEKLGSGELREAFHNSEALTAYMPELMGFMRVFSIGMKEHMGLIEGLKDVAEGLKQAQERPIFEADIISKLFKDDALRAKYEDADREERNKILGLEK